MRISDWTSDVCSSDLEQSGLCGECRGVGQRTYTGFPGALAEQEAMNFIHDYRSPRVIFGPDSLARLPQELERLGIDRALVLTTPEQAPLGRQVAEPVIGHVAAFYDGATMHVPALVDRKSTRLNSSH